MGPRCSDLGKTTGAEVELDDDEASMGPRCSDLGKACTWRQSHRCSSRFNGAEMLRPRKEGGWSQWAGYQASLQWGRDAQTSERERVASVLLHRHDRFNGAEMRRPRKANLLNPERVKEMQLQWGRDAQTSERRLYERDVLAAHEASMGPRCSDLGKTSNR